MNENAKGKNEKYYEIDLKALPQQKKTHHTFGIFYILNCDPKVSKLEKPQQSHSRMTTIKISEAYVSEHEIEIYFSISSLSDISKISEKSLQGMKNLPLEIHFANITNKSCSWRKSLPLWGQSIGEVQR